MRYPILTASSNTLLLVYVKKARVPKHRANSPVFKSPVQKKELDKYNILFRKKQDKVSFPGWFS